MSISSLRGAMEWSLMVALVFGAGALAQAQDKEADVQGPVIQIGKTDGNTDPALPPPNQGLNVPGEEQAVEQPQAPKYWIGLAGGAIPAEHPLRAHVDIPEKEGLLVAGVLPNSPAAKAGVKQNDIMLRANDAPLHQMQDLVELVLTQGEKKESIALDVLRHGNRETLYITPEVRPADAPQPQLGEGGRGFGGDANPFAEGGIPSELMEQFGGGNSPFQFRTFGPGVIVGGGQAAANIPNGVSVSIQKEDGKPAHITVKRGEETWDVVGDDPESLKQLPEDLRPFVEQMLQGGGGGRIGQFMARPGQPGMPEMGDGRLRERLERMEQRMEQMQKRLLAPETQPADKAVEKTDKAE